METILISLIIAVASGVAGYVCGWRNALRDLARKRITPDGRLMSAEEITRRF